MIERDVVPSGHHSQASAAAAAPSSGADCAPLEGPSKEQRAALRAIPSGLAMSMAHPKHLTRSRKPSKLVKDGQVVYKVFDLAAARPLPAITSLEQSITVTMGFTNQGAFSASTTVPSGYGFRFRINDFAQTPAYTGLFDQYKFEQIEVWLTPSQVVTNVALGDYVSAVDLDDANTPTTYVDPLAKQSALSTSQQAGHYHKWKPHMAIAAFSGAFTSYSNQVAGWIDSASPSVEHYGLKVMLQPSSTVLQFNMEVRAVVSFRSPGVP